MSCLVQGVYPNEKDKECILKVSMCSAIQVEEGLKKGDLTFLETLVEIKPEKFIEVPDQVVTVLNEFADVMPSELPKALPPRRAVDHIIELEPSTRPPAEVPYRMAPSELAKLRKQLTELLDAGLIQTSKAPYGAPILFQKKQMDHLECVWIIRR